MYQQDFLKRQIELLVQAIARMVLKREQGQAEEALVEARQAYAVLGISQDYLKFDSQSIARLIGSTDRLTALCALLEEEANIQDALGNTKAAERHRQRAGELHDTMKVRVSTDPSPGGAMSG